MAKECIGYVTCKYCGYDKAEVKETKKMFQSKAHVMVWCPAPDCQRQYFPRSAAGSNRIRESMNQSTDSLRNEQKAPIVEAKPVTVEKIEVPKAKSLAEFIESL